MTAQEALAWCHKHRAHSYFQQDKVVVLVGCGKAQRAEGASLIEAVEKFVSHEQAGVVFP